MKTSELRQLSMEQLQEELLSLTRERFNLRIQKATGQLTKPHLFKRVKKSIAQVKTIMSEKQHEQREAS